MGKRPEDDFDNELRSYHAAFTAYTEYSKRLHKLGHEPNDDERRALERLRYELDKARLRFESQSPQT
jgi:hypothetical protein